MSALMFWIRWLFVVLPVGAWHWIRHRHDPPPSTTGAAVSVAALTIADVERMYLAARQFHGTGTRFVFLCTPDHYQDLVASCAAEEPGAWRRATASIEVIVRPDITRPLLIPEADWRCRRIRW